MHPVIGFEPTEKELEVLGEDIKQVKRALQDLPKNRDIWKELNNWRQKYLFQRFCNDTQTIVAIGKAAKEDLRQQASA